MPRSDPPYHHGDLRAALIGAALEMLETVGLEALSLRGLAEAAGVSRSAPYAHFKDKRELLAAVAEIGFDRFGDEMSARSAAEPDARRRFLAIGRGYAGFALGNPNLFKLMFGAELASLRDLGQLRLKNERTYGIFRERLDDFLRENGLGPSSFGLQTLAWSCIHGLSLLLMEARLPAPAVDADAAVEEVTTLFAAMVEAWAGQPRPTP